MKSFRIHKRDAYVGMSVFLLSVVMGSFYFNHREAHWKRKWMDLSHQLTLARENMSELETVHGVEHTFYADLGAPSYEELFRYAISPNRTFHQFQSLCQKYNVSSVDVCNSRKCGRFLRFEICDAVYCVTRLGRLFKYKNRHAVKEYIDIAEEQNLYDGQGNNTSNIFSMWNEIDQ